MIILIGYMGSGKSTVGKVLAKQLEMDFIDFDHYIETKEKLSIPDIFKQKGEVYFRNKEAYYLGELLTKDPNAILSLGGGTPCFGTNMQAIVEASPNVFYLKLSVDTLISRLQPEKSYRPLIKDIADEDLSEFIRKHLFERNFYYLQAPHKINVVEQTPEDLAVEIREKLS